MITFDRIPLLAKCLTALKVSNSKEANSAVNCIKIEQIEQRKTKFTTFEPHVGIFSTIFKIEDKDCYGTVGETYIVDANTFINKIEVLAKTNCKYLSIDIEEGMLVLFDNLHPNAEGGLNYTEKDFIGLYHGDDEEFNIPLLENYEQVGYMPRSSLDHITRTITEVGQFTDSNETYESTVNGAGRTVLLSTVIDKINLFMTSKNKSIWFTYTQPASFELDKTLVLEGRHFNRTKLFYLNDIDTTPVNVYTAIYQSNNDSSDGDEGAVTDGNCYQWICFMNNYSSISFRVLEFEDALKNYLTQFNLFKSTVDLASRTVSWWTLANSIQRLEESSKNNGSGAAKLNILFLEDDQPNIYNTGEADPIFKIKNADSLNTTKEFILPILNTDGEDFLPCAFSIDSLNSILKILRIYTELSKESIGTNSNEQSSLTMKLGLYEKSFRGQSIISMIMFLEPTNCLGEISILAQPKDGLDFFVPDEVEADESETINLEESKEKLDIQTEELAYA